MFVSLLNNVSQLLAYLFEWRSIVLSNNSEHKTLVTIIQFKTIFMYRCYIHESKVCGA